MKVSYKGGIPQNFPALWAPNNIWLFVYGGGELSWLLPQINSTVHKDHNNCILFYVFLFSSIFFCFSQGFFF